MSAGLQVGRFHMDLPLRSGPRLEWGPVRVVFGMIADQRRPGLGEVVPGFGHFQELIALLSSGQLPGKRPTLLGMLAIFCGCFHWPS